MPRVIVWVVFALQGNLLGTVFRYRLQQVVSNGGDEILPVSGRVHVCQ